MTLLTETERELDSLRYELVVQNSSGGSSSTLRDMERRLKRWEWRVHLFKRMKANYESAGELVIGGENEEDLKSIFPNPLTHPLTH